MHLRMAAVLTYDSRAPRDSAAKRRRGRGPFAALLLMTVLTARESHAGVAEVTSFGAGDHVRAELIADVVSIAPGKPFRIAVRLVMEPGWHVNWLNPGDAGLAPGIAWRLPAGLRAGLIEWPLPGRFTSGPLSIFGYGGEVVLSSDVAVPADLAEGSSMDLVAEVSWLACADACVPGSATVNLRVPVEAAARPDAEGRKRIDDARARCPAPAFLWDVSVRRGDGASLLLDIQTAADTTPVLEGVFFFPYEPGVIQNAAAQLLSAAPGPHGRIAYELRVECARIGSELPKRLAGILVCESGWTPGAGPQAIAVDQSLVR